MREELKSLKNPTRSLKNPTRILTIVMFLAGFICYLGTSGLHEIFPNIPNVYIAAIVTLATYAITQYGTEKRIVRAEELKDQEYELTEDVYQ